MDNNRHAYLILVHNCPRLLQVLIDMIDDERNDIYIHVDKKADRSQFVKVHAKKSRIVFVNRLKVYWANISQIEAVYILLKTAQKNGPYLYYHFLSGVDLPLKDQDYIHQFFDEQQRGKEFVGFAPIQDIDWRVRYYHFFTKHLKVFSRMDEIHSVIREYALRMQKKLGVWRNRDVTFYKGAAWFSITDDFCSYLLMKKKTVDMLYKNTFCPDESYLQTIIIHSPFREMVLDMNDEYKSCMRLIDWEKNPKSSSPHTWTREDWDELTQSDRLFARKFSEDDMDFIYRLKSHVLNS